MHKATRLTQLYANGPQLRGWTEFTEPCKCPSAKDEDAMMRMWWGAAWVFVARRGWMAEQYMYYCGTTSVQLTHPHKHTRTHTYTNSGTTGRTSRPEGCLEILLMLSDANDLAGTTGLRQEHWVGLSQEITHLFQPSSHISFTAEGYKNNKIYHYLGCL